MLIVCGIGYGCSGWWSEVGMEEAVGRYLSIWRRAQGCEGCVVYIDKPERG